MMICAAAVLALLCEREREGRWSSRCHMPRW